MNPILRNVFFTAVLVTFMAGCASAPGEILLPSVEKDKAIGKDTAKQVEAEMGLYSDAAKTEYLKKVGRRLVDVNPDQRFEYSFAIIDQFEPNAFALPGGWIYVSRGMLILTNDEAELANVLGHEMIHVTRRHSVRQMSNSLVPGLLSIPGLIVGGVVNEQLGDLINAPVNLIGGAYLASHSRKDEFEADEKGQQLAALSGYDPASLAPILDRLEGFVNVSTGEKRIPGFFDTHPTTPDRVERVIRDAKKITWVKQQGIMASSSEYLKKLDGLLVGENPAVGIFRGPIFLQPELQLVITFPEGWKYMNTPQAVFALAPQKDGMVSLGISAEGTDPAQPATQFKDAMKDQYGITPVRSESLKINGLSSHLVEYVDQSKKQGTHLTVYWIAYRDLIYHMVCLAPASLKASLDATALSFRSMNVKEKDSIKENRLRIVTARSGETLATLSKRTGNVLDLKMTAVINGIDAEKALKTGQLIKIAVQQSYSGS